MRKLSGLIVTKRYIVLGVMLLITIACVFATTQVNINTDMTKYLPDDSSMKIGLDVMSEEFPEAETTQTIRVMFDNINLDEKAKIKSDLEAIPYVDSVDFDTDSEDYNRDNHTLYVIHTIYDYGSAEENAIESAVKSGFSGHEMSLKNDNTAQTDIPLWIVAVAFGIMLAILFSMCGSWIEPFLFLISIGCAIVINLGSNIFMGEVSSVTFSVAAILQMVLSMDYSIILMNRYRQELKETDNKTEAMKQAIKNAFSSIMSSAFTTIVGLLVLVFMRFKIGLDMGLVLAKGVTISLICIFTILPGLILLFDKAIKKTSKKELHVPTGGLGSISFRFRGVFAVLFVVLFVASFILQGNTKTAYTLDQNDPIADIFTPTNTIVLLYDNADDKAVTEIAESLKTDPRVKSAASYSTTIGKKYPSKELADFIDDLKGSMDMDMEIDSTMLDILYYDYFNKGDLPPISASGFINFIADDVVTNENFSGYINADIKGNMDAIKKFADKNALTRPMNVEELAAFFDMNPNDMRQLFIYYFTQNGGVETGTMTLSAFADFITDEVATDKKYSSMIDKSMLSQIKRLSTFTNAKKMTTPVSYAEVANTLGLDKNTARMMFVYYYAQSAGYEPKTMTLSAFVDFIKNDIADNPLFAANFDADILAQMDMLRVFTDKTNITQQMSSAALAQILQMDTAMVDQLFMARFGVQNISDKTMSPSEFVDFLVNNILTDPIYASQLDETAKAQLSFLQAVMNATLSDTKLGYSQMAKLLGIDGGMVKMLYTYKTASMEADSWKLSVQTLVNFLINNNTKMSSMMSKSELSQLNTVKKIINGGIAGTRYSCEQIAGLLNMSKTEARGLYLLYASKHGNMDDWKMSSQTFVDFVASEALSNADFKNQFDSKSAEELTAVKKLITAVVSEETYTAKKMSDLFDGLSDEIDSNTIELIYLFHASREKSNPDWELSMETLFDYLSDDVVNNPRFASLLEDDLRKNISDYRAELDDGIAQLKSSKYSRLILNTTLPGESEETSEFFGSFTTNLSDKLTGKYYLIGNSAMTYEMENSFGNEMLFISLLTAITIFLVVLLTFRNFIISTILILIVQSGVFITVTAIGLQGFSIYYLALLIVQSILMGATIDYGILFTNYYREKRQTLDSKSALKAAYEGSIHTILTSALIMILVTGIVGFFFEDPVVGQICRTISIGALSATLLILFVLPGLLATFDRFVINKKKRFKENTN